MFKRLLLATATISQFRAGLSDQTVTYMNGGSTSWGINSITSNPDGYAYCNTVPCLTPLNPGDGQGIVFKTDSAFFEASYATNKDWTSFVHINATISGVTATNGSQPVLVECNENSCTIYPDQAPVPTRSPSFQPSQLPTITSSPSQIPSMAPTTRSPTNVPVLMPTEQPHGSSALPEYDALFYVAIVIACLTALPTAGFLMSWWGGNCQSEYQRVGEENVEVGMPLQVKIAGLSIVLTCLSFSITLIALYATDTTIVIKNDSNRYCPITEIKPSGVHVHENTFASGGLFKAHFGSDPGEANWITLTMNCNGALVSTTMEKGGAVKTELNSYYKNNFLRIVQNEGVYEFKHYGQPQSSEEVKDSEKQQAHLRGPGLAANKTAFWNGTAAPKKQYIHLLTPN